MRNLPRQPASQPTASADGPTFRLRYVLFMAVAGLVVLFAYPRAKAAWKLHDQASALANYGLCMVGPTGPTVLRESSAEFASLLRRRLLSAEENDRPFAACRALFEQYFEATGDALVSPASAFQQYGSAATVGGIDLARFVPTLDRLAQLADDAWPFHRKPYLELVKPATHAKEAPHPVDFPMPVAGSGLPNDKGLYRTAWIDKGRAWVAFGHGVNLELVESADGGQHWQRTALTAPGVARHAGRCAASDAAQSFVFEQEDGKLAVVSLAGDDPVARTTLRLKATPRSSSCDADTAVFIAEPDNEDESPLAVLCQHGGRCGKLQVPAGWLADGFDIAQIKGVTVFASVSNGVVRVRSSRDHGKSWTPATVAIDAVSAGLPMREVEDVHLQTVADRLLLWVTGSSERCTYPLVVSEDLGASFRGAGVRPPRLPSRATAAR
jgi:hypothetical protein